MPSRKVEDRTSGRDLSASLPYRLDVENVWQKTVNEKILENCAAKNSVACTELQKLVECVPHCTVQDIMLKVRLLLLVSDPLETFRRNTYSRRVAF